MSHRVTATGLWLVLASALLFAAYVEPDVAEVVAQEGSAHALVVIKESPTQKDPAALQAKALDVVKAKDALSDVNVTRRYESIPVLSVNVTAEGLEKLVENPWVESVYWDRPVRASVLSTVPVIHADDVWARQVNGVNLTGKNQTICVLDTGVDYRHESLGSCSAPVQSALVNANRSHAVDSVHPYANNANVVFTINSTQLGFGTFDRIAVHFVNVSTENAFDVVSVEDPLGNLVAQYSGVKTNFWSPSVPGDALVVRLRSDGSTTDYGFSIDLVNNGSTNADVTWNCPKVIGGYDFVNNDVDPLDDNFHGTHVASTAAGNGSVRGVAPDARLLAVKVLDANGNGFFSDVIAGMDWCTTNKATYNVTALSMSLGTEEVFASTCDARSEAQAVSRAFDSGLFVAVSSGNEGATTGVSSPACASKATAVGATSDADAVASFSNAWTNFLVLAPGNPVTAAYPGNLTSTLSGTSMAAPHVAGVSALLQQFAQSANGSHASPQYVKDLVNRTGVPVTDTRINRVFYRVDALAAVNVFSSEVSPRSLSLDSFANGSIQFVNYSVVNVSFVDDGDPSSCILEWSNGSTTNFTMAKAARSCQFNVTQQSESNATFRVYVADAFNNTGSLFGATAFDVSPPQNVQANFTNNSFLGSGAVTVNLSYLETQPHTCVLSVDGVNQSAAAGASLCLFDLSFSDGSHNVTGFVNDSSGRINSTGFINFTVDAVAPASLAFVSPTPANGSYASREWIFYNFTFVDENPDSCVLWRNNTPTLMTRSGVNCFANATSLGNGQYDALVEVNDSAGHAVNSTLLRTFLDTQAPSVSAVSPSRLFVNGSTAFDVSSNASDNLVSALNVTLSFQNASGTVLYNQSPVQSGVNYSFSLGVLALDEGNYTVNVSAQDDALNAAFNVSVNVSLDLTLPTKPELTVTPNASGFVFLNWSASTDAFQFARYDVVRNGSVIASTTDLNHSDASAVSGTFYEYVVRAVDAAENANASDSITALATDAILPRVTSTVFGANATDGSINVSWASVTLDVLGQAEQGVHYSVYRSADLHAASVSTMTLLAANISSLFYVDSGVLSAATTYLYVVASMDAANNTNASVTSVNAANFTTVAACTNSYSAFSACSNGFQSRTRTCLGQTETQTQACSSGGSSGGSTPSAPVGVGSSVGGVSGGSSGGGSGGGGGGGAGGSGKDLFVINNVPKDLELEPGASSRSDFVISSYYTGHLRRVNVTVSGVPGDWYTVNPPDLVTPVSNTSFSIDWHPPEDASGNHSVRIEVSGVGTRTAGILKTQYEFELVLPPAESTQSGGASESGAVSIQEKRPSIEPEAVDVVPGETDYSAAWVVFGVLVGFAVARFGYEHHVWRKMGQAPKKTKT